MDAELILPPVVCFTVAALIGWLLPRFSRNFLGPALIILTLVGCMVFVSHPGDIGRDAWGPAVAIIALYVGGVGVVSGLILVGLGAIGARSVTPAPLPYSKEKPYRLPRPGLFTPVRLLVAMLLVWIAISLFFFL